MTLNEFHMELQRLSSASSIEEIGELCRLHCRQLGFDNFVYALRVPAHFSESRLIFIDGYPNSWVDHYFAQDYQSVDPVMDYCANHIVPIQWHDLKIQPSSLSARMMDEAGEFGLKSGITMPVHSPHGELGVLSYSLDSAPAAAREITQHAMPYVQLLGGYLHEAVRRVSGLVDDISRLQFTEREQECLRWAADGKTSWEIAKLLNVSERTANFHLNNSSVKLGTSNRQHAIAIAILKGIIKPDPF